MGYVNSNLMAGENVLYSAKIHWYIYMPSLFFLLLGIIFIMGKTQQDPSPATYGIIFIILSLYLFLKSLIIKISTELSVTSKRVIAKTGLIRRNTIELNHSKVESFHVDQSIIGRILGYGTLVINGTGGGKTPIRSIDSPLEFRRKAMEAIDASQS